MVNKARGGRQTTGPCRPAGPRRSRCWRGPRAGSNPRRVRVVAASGASTLDSYKKEEEEREAQERDRKFVAALDEARLAGAANARERTKRVGMIVRPMIRRHQRGFHQGHDLRISAGVPRVRDRHRYAADRQRGGADPGQAPKIREVLAAALDDWAWRAGPPDDSRLRTIAREADPDPWRNAIRDAEARGRMCRPYGQRAHDPDVTRQPAATLDRLGSALVQGATFDEAVALLRQAQRLYPDDFWINHEPGTCFHRPMPASVR